MYRAGEKYFGDHRKVEQIVEESPKVVSGNVSLCATSR